MNKYQKYCTGCGLCEACHKYKLVQDEKGFLHPSSNDKLLEKICPISGIHTSLLDSNNIWGRSKAVYLGWSNNTQTRYKASSGGVLTETACYLLSSGKVDAIIHIGEDKENPIKTRVFFSRTPEDVKAHSGSRYCISSPLLDLDKLDENKKYAFIGKPCDVVVLRNYMEINQRLKENIPYLLSFFCMGLPSDNAQQKLLNRLKCENCCKSLEYRGNGWPGFATAIDDNGNTHSITYDESWGQILGRDLMPACKFCIDGIGEMADISCGDAWYISRDNIPDFSEHEGRNVVFARTNKGKDLLDEMKRQDIVSLETYENYEVELPVIQKSQWNRRREMRDRILTMKLFNKEYPSYNAKLLNSFAQSLSLMQKIRIFLSTSKRILKGKM